MPRATMDAVGDMARPRAGDDYDAAGPKPAQRQPPVDKAPGAAALLAGARPRPVRMSPASLQRLGGAAGNRAVANLLRPSPGTGVGPAGLAGQAVSGAPAGPLADSAVVVQRYAGIKGGGGSFAPPAPPVPPNPKGDPKFLKVTGELKKVTKQAKKHPPAKAEAKKAQAAAVPPGNDKEAQAKAKQADKLAGAKKGGFDKAGFIAALTSALTKIKPKNLEESDDLASSGKADQVKNEVVGKVVDGKKSASQDLEAKAKEPPDPSAAKDKPVAPLKPEPEPKLATPKFDQGMPPKAPAEQTNLSGGKNEADAKLKEADVSEADLKKSNEPEMMKAVEAKKEGEEHSAKAPQELRKAEAQTIKSAENSASSKGKGELAAMLSKKKGTVGQVQGAKSETKSKDEAERAKVTANVNKIFDRTKTETETILNALDGKVTSAFESGEAEAKAAFTNTHQTAMRRYKADRYGGFGGGLLWAKDKLLGMPEEVNAFYEAARGVYIAKMTTLAHKLADLVDGELTRAKQRVQAGRDEIKTYVASLPKDLQKVGAEAAKAVEEKFDSLESDVDNKGSALQEEMATKYTEAMEKVNADIEAMQAENKGLWDSIKDAIGGAIESILKLKDLFMGMLAKAAGAFKKIISDPIGFIGNFLGAVKAGFMAFASRIGDHLKKGLQGWLFGKLGEAGIEIPDKLDLPGIIKMVLSILGLTWAAIRPKIVKRIGEKAMGVLETASDVFTILVKEGIPGLWKWIVDKVGDLKEMVVGQIRNFVIEKIVKAGITWVLGMLNPAGALIKIIQTLISVIQWIMEKGAALVELVGTIIDSVSDIAHGGMGGVPAKIEGALAKAVPIVISFLASLLGLGGIGEKIKSILDAVRKPVGQAVDAVISGALKVGKKLIAAVKSGAKKGAQAIKDAVQWVARLVLRPPVVKPFSLAGGEAHTVTMTPTFTGAKLTLASAFAGEAKPVLLKAKQEASTAADKQAIDSALSAVKDCETATKDWAKERSKAEKSAKARIARWVKKADDPNKTWPAARRQQEFERLVAEKEARKYREAEMKIGAVVMALKHLKSLDKLTSKTVVKKRQLPAGYDIRANLYERGSGWKSKSSAIKEKQLDAIVQQVTKAKALGIPGGRSIIENLVKKKKLNANAVSVWDAGRFGPKSVLNTKYDLDHVVPLAKHWKTSGSKSGDQARWEHCVDPDNLNLITKSANTSKQAEGAAFGQKFYVETSFTSMFADGGVQNAKRIDGRSFIDMDTGKELK